MPRIVRFLLALLFTAPALAQQTPVYEIDPGHTRVAVTVNHLGFSKMPGFFYDVTGMLRFDPHDVGQSALDVKINAKAFTMGHLVLDKKLRGPEYFNTAQYPTIRFRATHVETTGMETGDVTGNLTFLGVTRPVTLHVRFNRKAWDQYTNADKVGFTAWGKINRSDFGMKTLLPDVGDEVKLRISVEAYVPTLDMKLKKQEQAKKLQENDEDNKALEEADDDKDAEDTTGAMPHVGVAPGGKSGQVASGGVHLRPGTEDRSPFSPMEPKEVKDGVAH